MSLMKTGLARAVLATGVLLLSGAPLLAATPVAETTHKAQPPTAQKSAPVPPSAVTPTPAPGAPGPSTGPAVSARKGRGHF